MAEKGSSRKTVLFLRDTEGRSEGDAYKSSFARALQYCREKKRKKRNSKMNADNNQTVVAKDEKQQPQAEAFKVPIVRLGETGLQVSRLCLGCASFGSKKWQPWVVEEEESILVIQRALELGNQI